MKIVNKAITGKSSKPGPGQLHIPTDADWAELVKHLKLSETRAEELRITIVHAVEDLRIYRQTMEAGPDRKMLVLSLKRMENPLYRLKLECNRGIEAVQHLLPLGFLASIGRSWTFAGISEALGKNMYPRRYDLTNTNFDLRAIEEETAHLRQTLGLRHGHVLLATLVAQWHVEVEKQLALERLNKGGRKAQLDRKYLLHCLATAAPGIIGRKASVAVTGPFIRLCEAVLPACGLYSRGVDKVVPSIVREIRDSQKKRVMLAS